MGKRKKLKDLTIRDNFMFAAVMMQGNNSKDFLEMTLNIKIARIEISYEKNIIYNPECKGVRFDVYCADENNTRYDIEIQIVKKNLRKRSRYYHSQMDMEALASGHDYEELPNNYVIFICDFDPFGLKKYCYTFENCCLEDYELKLEDGCTSIFLSTRGENPEEISKEMELFLKFVREDSATANKQFEGNFTKQIQESMNDVKKNRELENRRMTLEEYLEDEKILMGLETRREDIMDILEEFGEIPKSLFDRIMLEDEMGILKKMLKAAAKADSLEQFEELISNL